MSFYQEDKKIFADDISKNFQLNTKQVSALIESLEKGFFENDAEILYKIKYFIHFKNDPIYSKKIIQNAIKIFTFLLSSQRYTAHHETFNIFFTSFFDTLFIQRCHYAKKVEKRVSTGQKVLQHLSKKLNTTLQKQDMMIANVSHEMRTSLNTISGYLCLLKESNTLVGENENFLLKSYDASQTLNRLVSDILGVSKVTSGQIIIKKDKFWVDDLVIKCLNNFTLELQKKPSISLHVSLDLFIHKLYTDEQHIFEILSNLVGNAIKYTDKGRIDISLTRVPTDEAGNIELHFQIKDTGTGMTKEQLKYIFDPYRRYKTDKAGVGLGLYISSKLAKELKATLTVSSQHGQGSTFNFIIPCTEDINSIQDLTDISFYYYYPKKLSVISEQRIDQLKKLGANIFVFTEEKVFVNHLLKEQVFSPNIVSISTIHENYEKFDALVNYLKTLKQYKDTIFVAKHTYGTVSIKYFDKVFDYFAPFNYFVSLSKQSVEKKQYILNKEGTLTILVVDDIETNLEIFSKFVHKRYPDIVIDTATCGYEALGMYKVKNYALLFLDIKMPGITGIELFKKLQDIRPTPPTYALTADIYKKTYQEVMDVGFTKLLEKPLQLDVLYKTIEEAINV